MRKGRTAKLERQKRALQRLILWYGSIQKLNGRLWDVMTPAERSAALSHKEKMEREAEVLAQRIGLDAPKLEG